MNVLNLVKSPQMAALERRTAATHGAAVAEAEELDGIDVVVTAEEPDEEEQAAHEEW